MCTHHPLHSASLCRTSGRTKRRLWKCMCSTEFQIWWVEANSGFPKPVHWLRETRISPKFPIVVINTDCAFFKSLCVLLKKKHCEKYHAVDLWPRYYCNGEFLIIILNLMKMCWDEQPFPGCVAAGRAAESSGCLPGPDGSSRPRCGSSRRQPALPHKDPSPPSVPLPGTRRCADRCHSVWVNV